MLLAPNTKGKSASREHVPRKWYHYLAASYKLKGRFELIYCYKIYGLKVAILQSSTA